MERWLGDNLGWLLVLDNADDFDLAADFVHSDWKGHVLITSRAYATGGIERIELSEMEPSEGALFLLRRAKIIGKNAGLESASETDIEGAREISREVDGLPLALDQAGAFIEKMQSSLSEYLDIYKKEGAKILSERDGFGGDHPSVNITFSLAFKQAADKKPVVADLLHAAAFLAPDVIPEKIFSAGAAELGSNLSVAATRTLHFAKVLGEAGRFSLLKRDSKNKTFEIHRLVQQVLKAEMDAGTQKCWAERTIRALNKAFPSAEFEDWSLCDRLLPHVQVAARLLTEYDLMFAEAGRLLNEAGVYCYERAQFAEAEPLYKQSLEIRGKLLGADSVDVAEGVHNLARLYRARGKYSDAESLFKRSLGIWEKALGPDHHVVATNLNNLALLYYNQGEYAEAEPLYQRTLKIYEKALGPEHPDVASALNNLAELYRAMKRYAEAEPLYKRSLGIREKILKPNHPDLATSLNNLALLYYSQGKYVEAEPLYSQARAIWEKALGLKHPNVAASIHNMAKLYRSLGRFDESEALFKRSREIWEKALGPDHPYVALSLENNALLLHAMHREGEAEDMEARAKEIRDSAVSPSRRRSTE